MDSPLSVPAGTERAQKRAHRALLHARLSDYRNRMPAGTISLARASGGIGRRAGFRFL
jgi:hypothetical protein